MFEAGSNERFGGRNDESAMYAFDVIRVWRSILAHESPWNTMSLDDIDGCMHRVLIELLDEDCSRDRDARVWRLRAVAHQHGNFRHHQRCNIENLKCEFDVLGYALQIRLGRARLSVPSRRAILAVLNSEFCLVQSAAAGAWHRSAPALRWPGEPE